VSQYHFDPSTYLEMIRADVPHYDLLQDEIAAATADVAATRILELGVGTGETARRVLALHPGAKLVGIDSSEEMLAVAREALPGEGDLRVGRLEDPLPEGPFDLVVSALAVHHLDGAGKRDLFRRIAAVLERDGVLVLGDVVVPEQPEDAVTPLTPDFDRPDRLDDVLGWLRESGLDAETTWERRDLAVVRARQALGGASE
jgi:tRNA (cmo5U34)-methyltransferase